MSLDRTEWTLDYQPFPFSQEEFDTLTQLYQIDQEYYDGVYLYSENDYYQEIVGTCPTSEFGVMCWKNKWTLPQALQYLMIKYDLSFIVIDGKSYERNEEEPSTSFRTVIYKNRIEELW